MTKGENIRKYRKELGLTQKQLGELCGIAESTIRKYELNLLNPKLETVQKIAGVLKVFPFEILEDEPHNFLSEYESNKTDIELTTNLLKKRKIFNIVSCLRKMNIGYETEYRTDVNNGKLVFNHNDEDNDPMEDPAKIYSIPVSDQELIELEKQTDDYFKLKLQELVVNKKGGFLFFFDLDKDQDK